MEKHGSRYFMGIITFVITAQLIEAKYVNYDAGLSRTYSDDFFDKEVDFPDVENNLVLDNNAVHQIVVHRKLSHKQVIEISGWSGELLIGETAELKCTSFGSPTPLIYWVRSEDFLLLKKMIARNLDMKYNRISTTDNVGLAESKYVIDCATKEDEGELVCVSIIDDEILTASVNITVKQPESGLGKLCDENELPVITNHIKYILANQGGTVTLPCNVRNPDSKIIWETFEGKLITNGSHMQVRKGNLIIKNIQWSDMNEYTCIAMMDHISDRTTTFLYPLANNKEE